MDANAAIKDHVAGHKLTTQAIMMVARLGYPADETTDRLLCALAGFNCLDEVAPKAQKRLSHKLTHAAGNLARTVHDLHTAFLDALADAKVVEPVPNQPPTDKPADDSFDQLLAGISADIDAAMNFDKAADC